MRVENWNIKFLEALERAQDNAVSFGWIPPAKEPKQLHCLSFSSYMVEAITGRDYYAELAKDLKYDSPLAALKALRSLGYNSVEQILDKNFEPIAFPFVIRGDLILVPASLPKDLEQELGGLKKVVAVADPPFAWTMHSEHGVVRIPLATALAAYRVI